MIRVALAGHRGRTGGELARALAAAPDVEYVGGAHWAQIANATLSGSLTDPAAAGEPRDMQFALKLVF